MKNEHTLLKYGVKVPEILLPAEEIDIQKWAVIACDQFTSEQSYWKEVEDFVGDSPSTLKLILPECYLEGPDEQDRLNSIDLHMKQYQKAGFFRSFPDTMVYTRRFDSTGRMRRGLITALDLERYSYEKGSETLIRATEGTIVERIPPRLKIRKRADIEFPHILVLINDEKDLLFSDLEAHMESLPVLYNTPLMKEGGRVEGYAVQEDSLVKKIEAHIERLYNEAIPPRRVSGEPFLFAMGDGNHSFATAKALWEELKSKGAGPDHPARYALVEITNIFDPGILFEPIYRYCMGASLESAVSFLNTFPEVSLTHLDSFPALTDALSRETEHVVFGLIDEQNQVLAEISLPASEPAAGVADLYLKKLETTGTKVKIDYIHGSDTLRELTKTKNTFGVLLPDFHKSALFPVVAEKGALPRKTFSMGEAREKRYYLEGRKITTQRE